MANLVAFFDSPDLKQLYVDRVHEHQLLDQLVQGQGHFTGDKGCAVACTMHTYSHAAYEDEIGVPQVLARLEDNIFEGLPVDEAKRWPLRFLDAIPVGADLSMVWARFAVWLLRDELVKHDKARICERVAALYDRWIAGDKPLVSEWREARSSAAAVYAADAAAYAAARAAAATSAAADAADAYAAAATAATAATADATSAAVVYAADAAVYAAVYAAYAAAAYAAAAAADAADAYAADGSRARHGFWRRAADKLEALLLAAPLS